MQEQDERHARARALAARVIAERERRRMSRGALANRARIPVTRVVSIELARALNPSAWDIASIAEALDTSPEYLLTGKRPPIRDAAAVVIDDLERWLRHLRDRGGAQG